MEVIMVSQVRDAVLHQRETYRDNDFEGPRLVMPSFFLSKDRNTALREIVELLFAIQEETCNDYITATSEEIRELIDLIERS
jgi:hypothetical protein